MTKRRITGGTTGTGLSADDAKALLLTRHLANDGTAPALQLLSVLKAAYPEAQLPPSADSGPGGTDWQRLAWAIACDYVPAFQDGGKAQGRPQSAKVDLVATIDGLVKSGDAKTLAHAFAIATTRDLFPHIKDLRSAYYRERKKLLR